MKTFRTHVEQDSRGFVEYCTFWWVKWRPTSPSHQPQSLLKVCPQTYAKYRFNRESSVSLFYGFLGNIAESRPTHKLCQPPPNTHTVTHLFWTVPYIGIYEVAVCGFLRLASLFFFLFFFLLSFTYLNDS